MLQDVAIQKPQAETPKPLEPPKHRNPGSLTLHRYLILAAMVVVSSVGDVCLSLGMRNIGALSVGDFRRLIPAVFSPWVGVVVLLLLGFFAAYSIALSCSAMTYVLPASSISYGLVAG